MKHNRSHKAQKNPAGTKLARQAAQGALTKRHPSAVDDYFAQLYAQRVGRRAAS